MSIYIYINMMIYIFIYDYNIYRYKTGFTPAPSASPTIDGCDFDIEGYLDSCYCTESQSSSIFGYNQQHQYRNNYQNYDLMNRYNGYYPSNNNNNNYGYYDGMNNNNFLQYVIILLNIITLSYVFYINSGCGGVKRNKHKFQKVYAFSESEDAERHAINS